MQPEPAAAQTERPPTPAGAQPTNGVHKDAWDKWNQARDQQALLATNEQGVNANSALFGWSDLGTYGAWGYFPGYGYGWAPYEPAGWAPYSAGMVRSLATSAMVHKASTSIHSSIEPSCAPHIAVTR